MADLPFTFIPDADVAKYLDLRELVDVVERAFGNFSKGEGGGVVQPVRSVVPVPKAKGFLGCMPGYSEKDDILATKLVAFYPENKTMPTHQATILVFEPSNGKLKAVMDGHTITDMRTAAASAVATKYLANPESTVLAILGAGAQARSHYKILSMFYKFTKVNIFSRTTASSQKFAEEVGALCQVCSSVEEAVKDADIIVTATFAEKPILKLEWIKKGAHVNAVGACRPDWQEIDPQLMTNAVLYVDSEKGAKAESGDVILSKAEIYAEIGEVVNGTKEAYKDKTTVFKSLGMAIEDAVAAKLVYDKYEATMKS